MCDTYIQLQLLQLADSAAVYTEKKQFNTGIFMWICNTQFQFKISLFKNIFLCAG